MSTVTARRVDARARLRSAEVLLVLNPRCPECDELMVLELVRDLIWDYFGSPPAVLRDALARSTDARAWSCFGCGFAGAAV